MLFVFLLLSSYVEILVYGEEKGVSDFAYVIFYRTRNSVGLVATKIKNKKKMFEKCFYTRNRRPSTRLYDVIF